MTKTGIKIKYMVFGGFVAMPLFILVQLAMSMGNLADGLGVIGTGLGLSAGSFWAGKIIGDNWKGDK